MKIRLENSTKKIECIGYIILRSIAPKRCENIILENIIKNHQKKIKKNQN
jgi:hypothetical protein